MFNRLNNSYNDLKCITILMIVFTDCGIFSVCLGTQVCFCWSTKFGWIPISLSTKCLPFDLSDPNWKRNHMPILDIGIIIIFLRSMKNIYSSGWHGQFINLFILAVMNVSSFRLCQDLFNLELMYFFYLSTQTAKIPPRNWYSTESRSTSVPCIGCSQKKACIMTIKMSILYVMNHFSTNRYI